VNYIRFSVGLLLVSTVYACTGVSNTDPATVTAETPRASYQPIEGISSQERFKEVLYLLEAGEPVPARAELVVFLDEKPRSEVGQDLLRQIDLSASEYFPQQYHEIELADGASLSTLSRDYLGSLYKFHALAKYNGIARPRSIKVGETIRIPLTEYAQTVFALDAVDPEPDPVPTTSELPEEPEEPKEQVVSEPPTPNPENSAGKDREAEMHALHREALNAYRAQDLDKAISLWDQVLAIDPDYENASLYRSQAIELKEKLTRIN